MFLQHYWSQIGGMFKSVDATSPGTNKLKNYNTKACWKCGYRVEVGKICAMCGSVNWERYASTLFLKAVFFDFLSLFSFCSLVLNVAKPLLSLSSSSISSQLTPVQCCTDITALIPPLRNYGHCLDCPEVWFASQRERLSAVLVGETQSPIWLVFR